MFRLYKYAPGHVEGVSRVSGSLVQKVSICPKRPTGKDKQADNKRTRMIVRTLHQVGDVVLPISTKRFGRCTLYAAFGVGLKHPIYMLAESTNSNDFQKFLCMIRAALIDDSKP